VTLVKFSEYRKRASMKFRVDGNRYIVARLGTVPAFTDEVFSIIKDENEVTVVAREGFAAEPIFEERFFRLITFDAKLPLGLTGFLSHISALLASEDISILAFSAYSTDHLLVRAEDLEKAVEALRKDGFNWSR